MTDLPTLWKQINDELKIAAQAAKEKSQFENYKLYLDHVFYRALNELELAWDSLYEFGSF